MSKPISLSQKSRILSFLGASLQDTGNDVWDKLGTLDSGTASDVIETFYKRNNAQALNQLKHLGVIV